MTDRLIMDESGGRHWTVDHIDASGTVLKLDWWEVHDATVRVTVTERDGTVATLGMPLAKLADMVNAVGRARTQAKVQARITEGMKGLTDLMEAYRRAEAREPARAAVARAALDRQAHEVADDA